MVVIERVYICLLLQKFEGIEYFTLLIPVNGISLIMLSGLKAQDTTTHQLCGGRQVT